MVRTDWTDNDSLHGTLGEGTHLDAFAWQICDLEIKIKLHCAGPAGKWTDSHRSSLRWWSNWKPYGRHFLQTNYAPVRGEMFERQVGSCTRFETTSPPAIRRSNFDLVCPRSGWDLKFTRSTIARFVIARKTPLPNYATDVGFFQVCSRTNGCKMQDICSESLRRNGHSDISTFWCFAAFWQNLEYGTMPKQQPQLCVAVAATVLCLARHSAFT